MQTNYSLFNNALRQLVCLFFFIAPVISVFADPVNPGKLTCEYIENPLGISTGEPRLSWTLESSLRNQRQSAYELIVSDNFKDIQAAKGNVWTTGKITSSQSLHIVYAGSPLRSFTRYYWRVRVHNQDDAASGWSQPAWFETSMLAQSDWQASWIGDGSKQFTSSEDFFKEDPMPLFRRTFTTKKKIAAARLYISGLGYYEAYINGQKVGDHVLDPGWTNYSKQYLYIVHDITQHMRNGANAAGIMLGNGWYNAAPLRLFGRFVLRDVQETGRPCVKAQIRLQYTDGSTETIVTDKSWQTAPGPIIRNNIYLGEHYDAGREKEGWSTSGHRSSGWKTATETSGPSGKPEPQMLPPIRVTKVVQPVGIAETAPGVFVFDMGQNFAGVARIKVQGPAGTHIVLRYGEDKLKDGSVNVMTSVAGQIKEGNGGAGAPEIAWQEDSYILKGKGKEIWSPRFTFHGFRYVEVKGWPGKPTLLDMEGLRMNTDVPATGSFTSSNNMFNQLYQNIHWTFLSNIFGVQSDCPAREKLGYGGDIVATAESFIYNYNMAQFYRKAIQDFANDQRPRGGITETAPFVGIADRGPGDGSGPLGWQLAYPYLMKQLYEFYGDKQVIEQQYNAFVKQMDFLQATAIEGLHHIDISDHEALDTKPEAFSAALFYYHHAVLIAEFAGILNKKEDAQQYTRLANRIKSDIVGKFLVPGTGRFDNATQSAQILALWYNMADEKEKKSTLDMLMKEFERKDWHLSTGIFATKMMFDILRNENRNDIAYRIATQRSFPGWAYMIEKGATTLWESWAYSDGEYSQNHPMFGSVNEWFYRSLLGINAAAPGFEKIIVKPQPAGDLASAAGSFETVRGKITSNWKIENKSFTLGVEIPANTTAEIWVPSKQGSEILESGKPVKEIAGLQLLRYENGYAVIQTGSGKYSFSAHIN
ncbi:MAG: family 78 glycoside hydrolase catalytic domain [Chitinophagaceae bacterium]|nr:family 78 glycoside hydrolase catalytic domain [Chitinophagaceae bacterium]